MHYAEWTISRDLIKSEIARKTEIDGVNVQIVNAKVLVDYLNSKK
jgi:hypothetical protein